MADVDDALLLAFPGLPDPKVADRAAAGAQEQGKLAGVGIRIDLKHLGKLHSGVALGQHIQEESRPMRLFLPFHADLGDAEGLNAGDQAGHPGILGETVVDLVIECRRAAMAEVFRDERHDSGVVPSAGKIGLQVNFRNHNIHHNGCIMAVSQAIASISMVAREGGPSATADRSAPRPREDRLSCDSLRARRRFCGGWAACGETGAKPPSAPARWHRLDAGAGARPFHRGTRRRMETSHGH